MSGTIVILLAASLSSLVAPVAIANDRPLFEATEPLAVVLELPVKELLRQAKKRPTVPGLLSYQGTDADEVVLNIELTTRGHSRLERCSYPPLKINLQRKQVVSTEFAGQNKLKLVMQCERPAPYLRYLNQEYLIYRMYNLLTPNSLRVRMLEVTFRDSTGKRRDETHPGFFIESESEAAQRLDMMPVETNIVHLRQLDAGQLSVLTLFQYMIGNTDWSVLKGPGSEPCCHNGKLIGPPGAEAGWVVLPYDFDQSGLINAKYALPSESLPIKSVRQRLYRGFCGTNGELERTIELFNQRRAVIVELLSNAATENRIALGYVEKFFSIINSPEQLHSQVRDRCRGTRQ